MHVKIKKEDIHKTAFITPMGLYEMLRLGFGFKNAPAVFQRKVQEIFEDVDEAYVFMDDILIATVDDETHLQL